MSGIWNEGKGVEFYLDTDKTVFSTQVGGTYPQMVFIPKVGWKEYETGFNPFITRKVTEEEAKAYARAQ